MVLARGAGTSPRSPSRQLGHRLDLDPAAWALGEGDRHPVRTSGAHHLAGDLGSEGLGEDGKVPKAPQVQLEALGLDARAGRLVLDLDGAEIRLPRHGADRRQFIGPEPHDAHIRRGREDLEVVDGVADRRTEDGETGGVGRLHGARVGPPAVAAYA